VFIKGGVPWNRGRVIPLVDRFWTKVDKSGPKGCWIWTGYCNKGGYGTFRESSGMNNTIASRVAWKLVHDFIPEGLDVCHHCDNPACVNPEHLFIGTASDNLKDSVRKGKLNHQGEKNSNAKLTSTLVRKIRETNLPQHTLAKMFGVSKSTIYYIQKNITWAYINEGR